MDNQELIDFLKFPERRLQGLRIALNWPDATFPQIAERISCKIDDLLLPKPTTWDDDYDEGLRAALHDIEFNFRWLFPRYHTLTYFWIGVADGFYDKYVKQ